MADRTIPDAVGETFAVLTGELEDASAKAASAQGARAQADAKRAAKVIRASLRQIERRLAQLEALLE